MQVSADPVRLLYAFLAGLLVGALGGLIGLGGAEFRLPILISLFSFAALSAVILNKAMSVVVVALALVFRSRVVPVDAAIEHWHVIANLLAGSLIGAWWGADLAIRLSARALYRVLAIMLVVIAFALVLHSLFVEHNQPLLSGPSQVVAGDLAGAAIGVVASMMGVAGGELLIPTLILLFGADIKLAGSLSLAISLPTMLVGFARYSRDKSFSVLAQNQRFVVVMAAGSAVGVAVGAWGLAYVSAALLVPLLALILLLSAIKVWLRGTKNDQMMEARTGVEPV